MDLRPTDLRLPQPRVSPDHGFRASSDLQNAQAAITPYQQHGRPSGSKKPGTDLLLLLACFVLCLSLLLNIELLIMRAANHAGSSSPAVDVGNAAAVVELHDLAGAEATYRATSPLYTTDSTALRATGYRPIADAGVTLYAGINGAAGFCAVAGKTGGTPWFRYDSSNGGVVNKTYATEQQAQLACAVPPATTFAVIA